MLVFFSSKRVIFPFLQMKDICKSAVKRHLFLNFTMNIWNTVDYTICLDFTWPFTKIQKFEFNEISATIGNVVYGDVCIYLIVLNFFLLMFEERVIHILWQVSTLKISQLFYSTILGIYLQMTTQKNWTCRVEKKSRRDVALDIEIANFEPV